MEPDFNSSDFNSSDVEFEPAVSKRPAKRAGQASIDEIVKNAAQDHVSSKKTVRQLQFRHGALSTRREQLL
jgi:hypothetical protein